MIDSRYPNITPLDKSALFQIGSYNMNPYSSPASPSIPITPFYNMSLHTPTMSQTEFCSPEMFSGAFEQEPMNFPTYTIPSNVQPFSPLRVNNELLQNYANSPTFSMASSPGQGDFNHWDYVSSPTLGSNVDEKVLNYHTNLISRDPTPRALKAKRCPTNKCPCGGRDDCTEPGCIKSAGHFVCPVCSIEFSRKNSMRRHVLTHINLRPYECKTCQKSFYRSDIYKRHLLSKKCRKNVSQVEMMSMITAQTHAQAQHMEFAHM